MKTSAPTLPRRIARAAAGAVLSLSLAACGSQLDPEQVAAANGGASQASPEDGPGSGPASHASGPGVRRPSSGASGARPGATAGGSAVRPSSAAGGAKPHTTSPTGGASGSPAHPGHGASATGGHPSSQSCAGLQDGTGISDTEITIGNASDISGPIPRIFQSAQDAVQAYVDFFNATSNICGRTLRLVDYDSRTDAAADEQSYARACTDVFAMVGSMSAFDSGGAAPAQACGLPDIRAMSTTDARRSCTTCFAATTAKDGEISNALPEFVEHDYGSAAQHAGMVYVDADAAVQDAHDQVEALTQQGMHFDVVESFPVSEFNYAPYVQQLKDHGVRTVIFVGAPQQSIRLRQAMQALGYQPDLYLRDPSDYTSDFVEAGGDAVDGTVVYLSFVPFEEASSNAEMSLYLSWLHQVDPSAEPTFYGVYAWSAARLFVEKAAALGGKLSRSTLIDAVRATKDWTANGLHAPEEVGSGDIGQGCLRFIQLDGSTWKPVGGTKYSCPGATTVG